LETVKAIAFFAVWAALWLPLAIVIARLVQWHPWQPLTPGQKLPLLGSLYLIAPIILWFLSQQWGTSLADYGWSGWVDAVLPWAIGLAIGVVGVASTFTWQIARGWLSFSWQDAVKSPANSLLMPRLVLLTLCLGAGVGGVEELIFRGFLLEQISRDLPLYLAIAIAIAITGPIPGRAPTNSSNIIGNTGSGSSATPR